jgi:hypothetical protein
MILISPLALRPDLNDMADRLQPVLDRYKSLFSFSRVEGVTVERKYWRDRLAEINVQLDSYAPDAKKQRKNPEEEGISMENLMSGATSDVGPINPEQDFNMLARRDVDLVDKAVEQMRGRIKQLVEESVGSQLYDKAIRCMSTLRNGCIIEDENQRYNEFIEELEGYYKHKRRDDFWQLLCARGLNAPLLDTITTSPGSSMSHNGPSSTETGEGEGEEETQRGHAEEATADDLFDMIE